MAPKEPFELARRIFADPIVSDFLIRSSRLTVFSKELAKLFRSDLDLLAVAKQLKFFYNQPTVGVLQQLAILAARSVKRSVFVDHHCIFTTRAVIFVAPSGARKTSDNHGDKSWKRSSLLNVVVESMLDKLSWQY